MKQNDAGDDSQESSRPTLPNTDTPSGDPQSGYCPSFPIVGVGASAGGLDAFTQLLHELPVETGMALVLVPHLAPGHASSLAEILSRATPMQVTQAGERTSIEPNHVYVIPPGKAMTVAGGVLLLRPREMAGSQHV